MPIEVGILIILIIMFPSLLAFFNTSTIKQELSEIKETLQRLSDQNKE